MSLTGKHLSYSEDENYTPFVKEHDSKRSASLDLAQAQKHHQQRTVLQDLCLNTIRPPAQHEKSGGGGGSSPASTPVAVSKPDHEAHVQFAREFVVELVENVPKKSEKAAVTKHSENEDIVSLKSVSPSEASFQSVSSVAENTSLPDLLQPEFVYKKQTDTDTDTTEYESAAETDPLDAASPIGSLIAEDLLSSFEEALDKKYPSGKEDVATESAAAASPFEPRANSEAETVQSTAVSSELDKTFEHKITPDNLVSQGTDPSPLSEAYEDAGDSAVKSEIGESQVKPLDISGLCLCIDNLCLDSPRKPLESDLAFDCKDTVGTSNSSSDISVPGSKVDTSGFEDCAQVADQFKNIASTSVGDSTLVLEDSGTGLSQNFEITDVSDGVGSPKEIPIVLEAAKTVDFGVSLIEDNVPALAENDTNTTKPVKTAERVEVVFNKTVELNQPDSHQVTAETGQREEISFVSKNNKEAVLKDCVPHDAETSQVCEGIVAINETQKQHVAVVTEGFKKSDVPEDANTNSAISNTIPVDQSSLCTSVTDCVEETKNLLKSKLSPDLDSTWISTSLEVLSVDKEATSELTETAVHNKKSKPEAGIHLKSVEVPGFGSLVDVPVPATSTDIGAGDWKSPVEKERAAEVVKEDPTVLSELFEICNRQQKDLELGDETFVDGTEFFACSSKSANLKEELHIPRRSIQSDFEEIILDRQIPGAFAEFDQTIADEAEKILQEIINASSEFHETGLRASGDSRHSSNTQHSSSLSSVEVMADLRGVPNNTSRVVDENGVNPFISQSSLCRSPPLSGKPSPRSSSQGPSPCDSPRTKSRISSINTVKGSTSPHDHASGDASPNSRSGKNSPDRRISSNKGSPKHSINPEMNQSEAGPEIADDAQLNSGDVFKDPAAFEYLSSLGNSHASSDLRKESLYVKFDPLVGGISRTTDKPVPLPLSVELNSSVPTATSPGKEHQSGDTTPVKNPALSVIDKLISLSPSPMKPCLITPPKQPVISPVKESAPVQQEPTDISNSEKMVGDNATMVEELYLLRELCAIQDEKYKERAAQLEQEIVTLRGHIENLQSLVRESEDRETKLNKKVAEKAQAQKQMSIIMEEYEKTISRLVAEKEQERQSHELDKSTLLKDRDAAMGHLANIEIAFSDLHKKYERSKMVIEGFKKNEEVLRVSLAEYEGTIRKQEQKYDVLKSHAMTQLENANQELDSVRRSQQAETAKLKAMLKKSEVKTSSLEEMLEQKVKENQELASICDELINKVGNSE